MSELTFKEKLHSISFVSKHTKSKKIIDHTDTAVVTTTVKDESQDVNVTLTDCIRPHDPQMTQKYWKEQQ